MIPQPQPEGPRERRDWRKLARRLAERLDSVMAGEPVLDHPQWCEDSETFIRLAGVTPTSHATRQPKRKATP